MLASTLSPSQSAPAKLGPWGGSSKLAGWGAGQALGWGLSVATRVLSEWSVWLGLSLPALWAGVWAPETRGGTGGGHRCRPGQAGTRRHSTQPAARLPTRRPRFLSVSLPVWPARPAARRALCPVSAR